MTRAAETDHRTRVAAQRRERMRSRLIESPLWAFAEYGVGSSVIQEVIARAGRASAPAASPRCPLDLMAGSTLAAMQRMSSDSVPSDYPELVVAAILRGLGVPGAQAARLVLIELLPVQAAPDSLVARTHMAG